LITLNHSFRSLFSVLLSASLLLFATCRSAAAGARAERARFGGHPAVRMENDWIRVVVLPSLGGRIIEYAFKPLNRNLFVVDESLGKLAADPRLKVEAARQRLNLGGYSETLTTDGKLYEPSLCLQPFQANIESDEGGVSVILTARCKPWFIERRYAIRADSTVLRISSRYTNEDDAPHDLEVRGKPRWATFRKFINMSVKSEFGGRVVRDLHHRLRIEPAPGWASVGWGPALDKMFAVVLIPRSERRGFFRTWWGNRMRTCAFQVVRSARGLAKGESLLLELQLACGKGISPDGASESGAVQLTGRVRSDDSAEFRAEFCPFSSRSVSARLQDTQEQWVARLGSVPAAPDSPVPLSLKIPAGRRSLALKIRAKMLDEAGNVLLAASRKLRSLYLPQSVEGARPEEWGRIPKFLVQYATGKVAFFGSDELQPSFAFKDKAQRYGLGFRWIKPLERGYNYFFRIPFEHFPDIIVIDGDIVWERETGEAAIDYASFWYSPRRDGKGEIWFIRDSRLAPENAGLPVEISAYISVPCGLRCRRIKRDPNVPDAQWERYEVPPPRCRSPQLFEDFAPLYSRPAEWNTPPLKKPKWRTADIEFGAVINRRKGADNAALYKLLSENGINGTMACYAGAEWVPIDDDARRVISAAIERGDWKYLASWMDSFRRQGRYHAERAISDAEQCLALFPKIHFYFMCPEVGPSEIYGGETNQDRLERTPMNRFERVRDMYTKYGAWIKTGILSRLKSTERVRVIFNSDWALYPLAYYFHAGADLILNKTIKRQNVQIVAANARGTAKAYGKRFGLRLDTWVASVPTCISPDEIEHIMKTFFIEGANYMDHEGFDMFLVDGSGARPNAAGVALMKAARWARTHPRRGEHTTPIAAVLGYGNLFGNLAALEPSEVTGHRQRRVLPEQRDFDLLSVFFAEYGDARGTHLQRFCTGTPFGSIDIIPYDTPLEKLRTYKLLFFLGINAMTPERLAVLRQYVEQGGTLIITIGQLLAEGHEPRPLVQAKLDDFLGVRIECANGVPIVAPETREVVLRLGRREFKGSASEIFRTQPERATVIAESADALPVIAKSSFGDGTVYLYCTRFVSSVSGDINRLFLESLARSKAPLDIRPESDWLEYVVYRKGKTFIIAFINHGRVGFPCGLGKDAGIYEGTVTVHLDRLPVPLGNDVEIFEVNTGNFSLSPHAFGMEKDALTFRLKVDHFAEAVICPRGENSYFE